MDRISMDRVKDKIPLKLIFAFLAVQLTFWLLFDPNFIHIKVDPVPKTEITSFEYAPIKKPTFAALQTARFEPPPDQQPFMLRTGYHASRTSFNLVNVPNEGLALLVNDSAPNRQIYVNGGLLSENGKIELPNITYHGRLRAMERIPPAMLRSGINQLDTLAVFDASTEAYMVPPVIGPYKAMERAYAWPRLLFSHVPLISLVTGMVVSIFVFFALIRSKQRDFLFWFFILGAFWSINSLIRIWPTIPLNGYSRLLLYAVSTVGLSACWPVFVDAWTGRSVQYFRYLIYSVFAAATTFCAYWLLLDQTTWAFPYVETVIEWTGLGFMALTLLRLIGHFTHFRDDRVWEAALILTLGMLIALSIIGDIIDALSSSYLSRTQPLFLLLFAVAFFARNFHLFQSSAQINALLQAQLAERTEELKFAHDREKKLVRNKAHNDERQRIMRDMHDGLGSNLMSMLMMAKRGKAKHEDYAEGLQLVIDEMRLMIDSMESVGESLQAALAMFKKRVIPRVKMAGFVFNWVNTAEDKLPDYGPRDVLQVFRILQEAVTNALKHSCGNQIDISIQPSPDPQFAISIIIADNGEGLKQPLGKGRGLDNMRSRAKAIGAVLNISENKRGSNVTLHCPERVSHAG